MTSVSIHAPTGGATSPAALRRMASAFQFTRPRGARLRPPPSPPSSRVSIHAPTGGATWCSPSGIARRCFNSRAHGGRDGQSSGSRCGCPVSIHAPTGGATGALAAVCSCRKFQFTRPRGARRAAIDAPREERSFNSRAHGGRDRRRSLGCGRCWAFQFTRPRGARPTKQ